MSWSCSCQMWGDCEQNSNQSRLLTLTKSHVSSVKLFISHKMWILNRSQLSRWHCPAALTALTALCRYFGHLAPCIISRDFCRWKTEGKRYIFSDSLQNIFIISSSEPHDLSGAAVDMTVSYWVISQTSCKWPANTVNTGLTGPITVIITNLTASNHCLNISFTSPRKTIQNYEVCFAILIFRISIPFMKTVVLLRKWFVFTFLKRVGPTTPTPIRAYLL